MVCVLLRSLELANGRVSLQDLILTLSDLITVMEFVNWQFGGLTTQPKLMSTWGSESVFSRVLYDPHNTPATNLIALFTGSSCKTLWFVTQTTKFTCNWIHQLTASSHSSVSYKQLFRKKKKIKLRGLSPHANYTDRAAAAGRQS